MSDLEALLDGGQRAVYLLHGEATLLVRQAAEWLRHAVLGGIAEDFNLDRFDARDRPDLNRIVQTARTLPMMAARRLVLIRNAESLFAGGKETVEPLLSYLKSPDPSSCLVFQATERVKMNGALYKAIQRAGGAQEFQTPRERELPGWVIAQARARQRVLSSDAAAMLVEAIGRDLLALDAAVERLTLFVAAPGVIELAHVKESVPVSRTQNVWALMDAISNRDPALTLAQAHLLLTQGEQPLRLLGLVAHQLRQLLQMRSRLAEGATDQEAATGAGVPPFRVREAARQARNFGTQELISAIDQLARTDRALKSSKLPGEIHVEILLLDLCVGAA